MRTRWHKQRRHIMQTSVIVSNETEIVICKFLYRKNESLCSGKADFFIPILPEALGKSLQIFYNQIITHRLNVAVF